MGPAMRPTLTHSLLATVPLLLANPAAAQWSGTGPVWTTDKVGIGTSTPGNRLHVVENALTPTLRSENNRPPGTAVWGTASASGGLGVYGVANSPVGQTVGVKGWGESPEGRAVWGYAGATSGVSTSIYGQQRSPDGYSGYFHGGNFYVSGTSTNFLGLGRTWRINGTEAVGVYRDTSSWGGMYMATNSGGRPYYGYATAGQSRAYHYYDATTAQWRLNCGGTRLAVSRSSGRVGSATTSPAYTLHVNGTAGKPGGGSWANASDRRLKKDIEPIEGALDRLLSVRGVTYRYIDPEAIHALDGTQLGVVAQEVEVAFPGWVDEGDDGYKRVTFRGFEGVTIEALRELRDENERLKSTLADLTARLDALEAGSR